MSTSPALAIPKGSLVLVTGATGYIGSWTVYEFIKQGYRVRAAVRSQEKFDSLVAAIEKKLGAGDHLEAAFITDFTSPDAYTDAIKGVSAIVHIATDTSLGADPDVVVKNTVNAMKGLLDAAKNEPSIKRAAFTSSIVALPFITPDSGATYDAKEWNDWAVENMYTAKDPLVTYAASKTQAEKTFWEGNMPFERSTVLPGFVIGPALDAPFRSSSYSWFRGIWDNDKEMIEIMKNFAKQGWYVNVQDIARLHVGAVIFEEVKHQRLLGFAGKMDFDQTIDFFRKIDPQRTLPEKLGDLPVDNTEAKTAESVKVLNLFGKDNFISYEESVRGNIA